MATLENLKVMQQCPLRLATIVKKVQSNMEII